MLANMAINHAMMIAETLQSLRVFPVIQQSKNFFFPCFHFPFASSISLPQ
jgi:hypothetical protein